MKRKTSKLFALLLAMVMILALLPTAAFAENRRLERPKKETEERNYGYVRSPEHGTRAVSDAYVRGDMEKIFNHLVRENEPYYDHTLEGSDDMPAHAKSTIVGVSLTIPITRGRLNLGTWQGIYICEFRDYGGPRRIVATVVG